MGYGFWSGVAISTLLWCLVAAMLVYRVEFGGPSLEEASAAVTGVLTPPVGLRAVVKAVVAQRQLVGPGAPPTLAQVEPSASAAPSPARMPPALPGSRSAYAQRFTDMACFTQGDESEFCRYEHALCYDGEHLVMSVPEPPTKKMSSNEFGHIMGDVMANCYGKWGGVSDSMAMPQAIYRAFQISASMTRRRLITRAADTTRRASIASRRSS